jgi:hypothetical protein
VVREYVNGAVAEGNQVSTINGKDYLVTYNDVNNIHHQRDFRTRLSHPREKSSGLTPRQQK